MSRARVLALKLAKKLGLAGIQTDPCSVCGGTTLRELARDGSSPAWFEGIPCCRGCGVPVASKLVHVHRFGHGPRVGVRVVDLRGAPWRPHPLDPSRKNP